MQLDIIAECTELSKEAVLELKEKLEAEEREKENMTENAMVAAVSLTEFDQELYDKCRREEGRAEGLAEGAQQKAIEDARSFYENGVSIEVIAKSLKMTEEQVKEIVSTVQSK